jgi:hypothetical protein
VRSLGSPRRGDWHVREERQPTRRLPFPTARNSQRTGGRPIAFVTVQREYCGGRSLFQRTASAPYRLFSLTPVLTMRPESASGLYWSIRGKVLCAEHASEINDDRWAAENWEPLPESSRSRQYQCQRCSPDGTALADTTTRRPSPRRPN